MMAGRLFGPVLLDRTAGADALGVCRGQPGRILLVVFGAAGVVVALGIVVWGSAPARLPGRRAPRGRRPLRAARRVSAVSTIGYAAFLAGPPLLGLLADHVGTLRMLLLVAALMIPAAVTVFAAQERQEQVGVTRHLGREFDRWYGGWDPLDPTTVGDFMAGFERPGGSSGLEHRGPSPVCPRPRGHGHLGSSPATPAFPRVPR